jgi:2-oxoglutarate dehydrogenase E2 component (dihydrolipoamide succinyltransferase)
MSIEIKVPAMGESVTEATVARWFKQEGDAVSRDEPLLELETDKVTVEVPAPADGALEAIAAKPGDTVEVGALLGRISEGASGHHAPVTSKNPDAVAPKTAEEEAAPAAATNLAAGVQAAVAVPPVAAAPATADPLAGLQSRAKPQPAAAVAAGPRPNAAREERVTMTRLRKTIALRLKESQNTAAQLTTFNEIDMGHVMALRTQYKELFEKTHGVRLGFMGFFVKAAVAALKEIPNLNAEIEGDDIVYKRYFNIGVAVSTERGLMVPVLREADALSLAEIEKAIADFGKRARDNKLQLDELQGGSFSITNGGVFGSLMSTPILNAPQSGILGMHKIQNRPVADGDKIVIRPMMYVALSYDHRLVDGREAVTFLVRVKDILEDPQRLLLEI